MGRGRLFIYIAILLTFVSSAMILLMPYASNELDKGNQLASMLVGGIFWMALIASYVLLMIANQYRRKELIKRGECLEKKQSLRRMGIWNVFSNLEATCVDIVFGLAVSAFIMVLIITDFTGYICFVSLSFTFFLLHLHGILNGRIYGFIKIESAKPV